MKNIDVVALLNQKNAASQRKASKASVNVKPVVEEVANIEQEQAMLAQEDALLAQTSEPTLFDSFKETKVGRTAGVVWKKAAENKTEIALVAAGITVVAVVAGIVRHKRRVNLLKSFNEDK